MGGIKEEVILGDTTVGVDGGEIHRIISCFKVSRYSSREKELRSNDGGSGGKEKKINEEKGNFK